jgi:hypothetical protein
MYSARYSCYILSKLEFARQILKNPKISTFLEIGTSGHELLHVNRQRDRHEEAASRFPQLLEGT